MTQQIGNHHVICMVQSCHHSFLSNPHILNTFEADANTCTASISVVFISVDLTLACKWHMWGVNMTTNCTGLIRGEFRFTWCSNKKYFLDILKTTPYYNYLTRPWLLIAILDIGMHSILWLMQCFIPHNFAITIAPIVVRHTRISWYHAYTRITHTHNHTHTHTTHTTHHTPRTHHVMYQLFITIYSQNLTFMKCCSGRQIRSGIQPSREITKFEMAMSFNVSDRLFTPCQ